MTSCLTRRDLLRLSGLVASSLYMARVSPVLASQGELIRRGDSKNVVIIGAG
jgi:hypothetical protein